MWLLDPDHIFITSGTGADSGITGGPNFSSSADPATLHTRTIEAALMAGNNVTVTTGHSDGDGKGDIAVESATLSPKPPSAVSLTLNADRNITIDTSTLKSTGAALTIRLHANQGENLDGGAVALRSSELSTRGGDIVIHGQVRGGANSLRDGVSLAASNLDAGAGAGTVTVVGSSTGSVGESAGVAVVDNTSLNAAHISLTGSISSDANASRTGVKLAGMPVVASITLAVDGAALSKVYRALSPISAVDVLVELKVGVVDGPSGASMTITGSMNEGLRNAGAPEPALPRFAVGLRGAGARVTALGGASISITGDALSPNNDHGVYAVSHLPAFINASRALQLSIEAGSGSLSGELLAPEGGPLRMVAATDLRIDGAMISGHPSRVQLSGDTVSIGTSGAVTQLIFGDASPVSISGQTVQLGAYLGQNPFLQDPPAPNFVGNAGVDDLRHALAEGNGSNGPVPAKTTLSTGGTVSLSAVNLLIGQDTTVHSTARGSAIVATGYGQAPKLSISGSYDRRYDGSTHVDLAAAEIAPTGLRGGDQLTGTLAFANKNVGTGFADANGKPVYGYQFDREQLVGSIHPKDLDIAAVIARDKVYDGNTSAIISNVSLAGLVAGDTVTAAAVGSFEDRNAANGKLVTASDFSLAGIDAGNYELLSGSSTASISAKPVKLIAATAASKVYDGNTNALSVGVNVGGFVADDAVGATGSGSFADKNVGAGKVVSLSNFRLTGSDARNYQLNPLVAGENGVVGFTSSADITAATLRYVADPLSLVQGAPCPHRAAA